MKRSSTADDSPLTSKRVKIFSFTLEPCDWTKCSGKSSIVCAIALGLGGDPQLAPVQLLEETEKAIGDPQLLIQHHALVEKRRKLKNIEVAVKMNGETLDQEKALNSELEKGVERVCQGEELLSKALRNSGSAGIIDAYQWLQQHKNELKEVYVPVLLEVNVPDEVHADYLEGPIDRDFLVRNLKSFDVPILNYVRDEHHLKDPFQVSEKMHELGIYTRLDQVFDAPDAVKEYIGSKETDKKADDVAKLNIFYFWTPENYYRWSSSRYGGSDVGEIEKQRCRKEELEKSVNALEESFKLLLMEQRHLENEGADLQKKGVAQNKKRTRRELENRLDQKKRKLESVEEDDLDTSMAKLIDEAVKIKIQQLQHAIAIKNLLIEAARYKWSLAEKLMASIEFDAKGIFICKKEVEDRQEQLSAAKRHAESIAVITPGLAKAFYEMESLAKKLEADTEELKMCLAEIDPLKYVFLDEHDKDFDQFGILAKVNFRSVQFQLFFILFLFKALQTAQFRVVDEIKQGMDPVNERKMFQQLVRAASQPGTPQCFLLTPKLLPDLEYSEACSILNIMNGPWIKQPVKVWSNGECWRAVGGNCSECHDEIF
ncbi:hypothetical protein GH714_017777 [Hevea brasiliensis]|uniref:Structural maintenance of chromosomes protein 5 n=1 Tax=Hevea brasiliensis TaxID=3981 RepID=A0A6A6N516_HEVBR|nr:hypothetical protein GH714_017777 [Hevea brasiliensis]